MLTDFWVLGNQHIIVFGCKLQKYIIFQYNEYNRKQWIVLVWDIYKIIKYYY